MLALINILFNLKGCSVVSNISIFKEKSLEITFMNIGKADCILITAGDKAILIDTGLNSTKDNVVSELRKKGVCDLECLILTHMDKDHIGGAPSILNNFNVKKVVQADYKKDSKQYDKYVESLASNDITPVLLHEEISVNLKDVKINIYPALKKEYSKSNDYSIITEVLYGKYSFLFMGDAEEERLLEFMNMNNKDYDVVKIPHHGRESSVSEEFIGSIKPSYAVITCSEEDSPDDSIMEILEKYDVKTFLTSNGDVVMTCDGNNINIVQ